MEQSYAKSHSSCEKQSQLPIYVQQDPLTSQNGISEQGLTLCPKATSTLYISMDPWRGYMSGPLRKTNTGLIYSWLG